MRKLSGKIIMIGAALICVVPILLFQISIDPLRRNRLIALDFIKASHDFVYDKALYERPVNERLMSQLLISESSRADLILPIVDGYGRTAVLHYLSLLDTAGMILPTMRSDERFNEDFLNLLIEILDNRYRIEQDLQIYP